MLKLSDNTIILYPRIVEGFDVFLTILQCDIPHFAGVSSDIRVDTETVVNAPHSRDSFTSLVALLSTGLMNSQ